MADTYSSSLLVNAQAQLATKYNEAELRRKERPVISLATRNAEYTLPDWKALKTAEARVVEVKYLKATAAGADTAKAHNHTGTKGASGTLNLSYSCMVEKFYTSQKMAQNNVFGFERLFQHQLEQAEGFGTPAFEVASISGGDMLFGTITSAGNSAFTTRASINTGTGQANFGTGGGVGFSNHLLMASSSGTSVSTVPLVANVTPSTGATYAFALYNRSNQTSATVRQCFTFVNDANVPLEYASILGGLTNSTTGLESGYLQFLTRNNGSVAVRMTITADSKIGLGSSLTAPTARLHLPGGSAIANTAPLKIESGTLLSVRENGAIESDGSHIYWTNSSGTRIQLDN